MEKTIRDEIIGNIKVLNETIWENKITQPNIDAWLNNFQGKVFDKNDEELYSLFLLSNFMYFGHLQIQECLRSLYRDLYKYPIIAKIRKDNKNTKDYTFINSQYCRQLASTRFIGVGNPSESGCHLLYYFRQVNNLSKKLFCHGHEIFKGRTSSSKTRLSKKHIKNYIFIDDFCGSGSQAVKYLSDLISDIKDLDSEIEIKYLLLFATKDGKKHIKDNTQIDAVESVFELDDSYKVFHENSNIFINASTVINKGKIKKMCEYYGMKLWNFYPLGYDNGQILMGFYHNIPDNTLPIIWRDNELWRPIFKRYHKI